MRKREIEVKYEAQLGYTRQWESRARGARSKLWEAEAEARELENRYQNTVALLGHAQKQNERLSRQIEKLQDRMIDLAARPPHIVDTSDAIAKLTAGIRDIIAPVTVTDPNSTAEQFPMGEHVGEVDPFAATHFYIPSTEMDERWNGPAPIPGEWSATTPSTLREGETPSHTVGPMGTLQRSDGQPMFQAGVGAETPPGGVE